MHPILTSLGSEFSKDKWLVFFLTLVLLVAFIRTSNGALEQLLVTAVGGFLGLMRSGTQTTVSGEGNVVRRQEPKV